ncbi:hypothetical protein [Salinibacter ruber]|jgi:hypothetical protein|uniref:hypothetical protein n=1 Tax=Salinibacter ruber TaxID=146919 RepID=UPI0021692452|nr:hypothetical protein [Salinibacter ruber]MCS4152284.1 hypothetical protein [Salinibacter ruber]
MSAPERDEEWYQSRVRAFVEARHANRVSPFVKGSQFFPKVPFDYRQERGQRSPKTPGASFDYIELDPAGKLHLWELKTLHTYELTSGRVLGQLMFYDWMFRSSDRSYQKVRLDESGVDLGAVDWPEESDQSLQFESWNILVCGGYGYEIAAGINPVMWEHTVLSGKYFGEFAPEVATYHLYHDQSGDDEGLIMRNIWRLSVLNPSDMEPNALLAYLGSEENTFYIWRVENGRFHLALTPEAPPRKMFGLTKDQPERSLWTLAGRNHLYTEDVQPPLSSDVVPYESSEVCKIRLDWQGPVWAL